MIPWGEQLGIAADDEHPEADIEGATTLGGHVYWITSHGRNKDGKWRSNRHRFFAMTVTMTEDRVVAEPFGKPCRTLIGNLTRDPRMRDLELGKALGLGTERSKKLAPKRKGLNVEGLCATADGTSLLIGFRNPCPDGKALLVPLSNPAEVLTERAPPEFGDPIRLDLAVRPEGKSVALGIRSIEYSKRHGGYLILAGPHDEEKLFALYLWSGKEDDQPKLLSESTAAIDPIDKFTPEALIVYPQQDKIQLLSDDGTLKVKVGSPAECQEGTFENGECEAKFLLDDARKTFRSIWVAVE